MAPRPEAIAAISAAIQLLITTAVIISAYALSFKIKRYWIRLLLWIAGIVVLSRIFGGSAYGSGQLAGAMICALIVIELVRFIIKGLIALCSRRSN
jgi:hypothetical protein